MPNRSFVHITRLGVISSIVISATASASTTSCPQYTSSTPMVQFYPLSGSPSDWSDKFYDEEKNKPKNDAQITMSENGTLCFATLPEPWMMNLTIDGLEVKISSYLGEDTPVFTSMHDAVKGDARVFTVTSDAEVTFLNLKIEQARIRAENFYGGAIVVKDDADITVVDTIFSGNEAHYGGAIALKDESSATISGSTFTKNTANSDAAPVTDYEVMQNGGAINLSGTASITVNGSTFTENQARNGGAIFASGSGLVTIADSSFEDNEGQNNEAVYYNGTGSSVEVTNSSFASNGISFKTNSNPRYFPGEGRSFTCSTQNEFCREEGMQFSPPDPFSVIVASDPQYPWARDDMNCVDSDNRDRHAAQTNIDQARSMLQLLVSSNRPSGYDKPESVIVNGDLTNYGRVAERSGFEKYYYDIIKDDFDVYLGLGNHDYSNNVGSCQENADTWAFWEGAITGKGTNTCALNMMGFMGDWIEANASELGIGVWYKSSLVYAWSRDGVYFIQLQNHPDYENPDIGVKKGFTALATELQRARGAGMPVVINMHGFAASDAMLADNADLISALNGYEDMVLAIFAGHLHERAGHDGDVTVNNTTIPYFMAGSSAWNLYLLAQFNETGFSVKVIDSREGEVNDATVRNQVASGGCVPDSPIKETHIPNPEASFYYPMP